MRFTLTEGESDLDRDREESAAVRAKDGLAKVAYYNLFAQLLSDGNCVWPR